MDEAPTIDGRRRREIREHVESIAPNYLDEWDPDAADPGSAMVALFAEMASDVIERLDRTPEKHRVAFFDSLGFGRRPPLPATVPVTFSVVDGADRNAVIEPGTEVIAPAADGRPEQLFRIGPDDGFEATNVQLREIYSVDPATDGLYAHHDAADGEATSTLFVGEDRQENALYVGHPEVLAVSERSTITVRIRTDDHSDLVRHGLVWEYYGEREVDGEAVEGWHEFETPATWADHWFSEELLEPVAAVLDPAGVLPEEDRATALEKWLFRASTRSGGTTLADLLDLNDVAESPIAESLAEVELSFPELDPPNPPREDAGDDQGFVAVELTPDGPLVETTVNGVEGAWIRCRVPANRTPTGPFDLEFAEVALETQPSGLRPDELLANDVPLPIEEDESFAPFGEFPRGRDAFYLACEEAFTKDDATATIEFSGAPDREKIDDDGVGPQLSWEYWNGSGWERLPKLVDDTVQLRDDGDVSFTVPGDLESTVVAGHEGFWIRARLIAGDYGNVVYVHDDDGEERWHQEIRGEPPRYDDVSISYGYDDWCAPANLFAYNCREFGSDCSEQPGPIAPFEELPDTEQSVYFGFDGPLRDGPIQLFVDVADHEYPPWFSPRVRWEYCVDPEGDSWVRLDGRDASEGFTEEGIVGLAFSQETTAFSRFGRERHWIRARVRGDAFGRPRFDSLLERTRDVPIDRWESPSEMRERLESAEYGGVSRLADLEVPDARPLVEALSTHVDDEDGFEEVVKTDPPAGAPTNEQPTVHGIYRNAGMASNVTVVDEEIVGSSNGSPHQSFAVSRPPIVDEEVWVDELTALSAGKRSDLLAERPDDVRVETNADDEVREFWVRWEPVGDLLQSGPDDRHYVVDRVDGEISFGNGETGRIPPHGRDNVVMSYRTGGGPDGNVAPGAVEDLRNSIPLVEEVTNPVRGYGGASSETTDAVVDRASRALRDRGRAVTAADFERIARDASRRLARVRAIPGMDRAGDDAPGWVTLLIVPNDQRRMPTPSVGLKRQVRRAVSERAPASVVAGDRIVVRGPSYVRVGVTATIVAGDVASLGTLENHVDDQLTAFFHPLDGGEDGDGWGFGDLPSISDVFALLEGIEGVDHVPSLQLTYEGSRNEVIVGEGEPTPSVDPDVLVHSGRHELTLQLGERAAAPSGGT